MGPTDGDFYSRSCIDFPLGTSRMIYLLRVCGVIEVLEQDDQVRGRPVTTPVEEQPQVRLGVLSRRASVPGQVRHHGDPLLLGDVEIDIQVAHNSHLHTARASAARASRRWSEPA